MFNRDLKEQELHAFDLKWYVVEYENKEARAFNVFRNRSFKEAVYEIFKTPELSREELAERIDRKALWQFWSRCEYEMLITSWPTGPDDKHYKIDVYQQLKFNWDRFIDYVYYQYCFGGYV